MFAVVRDAKIQVGENVVVCYHLPMEQEVVVKIADKAPFVETLEQFDFEKIHNKGRELEDLKEQKMPGIRRTGIVGVPASQEVTEI